MPDDIFDLVVIGGGINGAGIAADAAARGLSVLLAEAGDLGGATSSASSKLIHGGLRYLEQYEFGLVRKALAEREILLAKAPHIIRPLRFVLPHVPGMRSRALIRAGLFLYDHLAARKALRGSRSIDLATDPSGAPLGQSFKHGFSYWDCAVDDARLVVLNAVAAREAGAQIETRCPVRALAQQNGLWIVTLGPDGRCVAARALVNASGPWVEDVARLFPAATQGAAPRRVRLVKGSHIVVPRIAGADAAYTLQNVDGRVVFILPFDDAFTLIGTTEEAVASDPGSAHVSADEEGYLILAANRYLRVPLRMEDIVWKFAGVRPLDDDGNSDASAVTRDFRLELKLDTGLPVVHVIGGKITTYRRLAEAVLELLAPYFPGARLGTTASSSLPGGDLHGETFESWFDAFAMANGGFERAYLTRLARRYGTRIARVLDGARSVADLGQDFGAGLSAREISYLRSEEWAQRAEDVLWRRTKAGLHILPADRLRTADDVQTYLDRN